MDTETLQGRKIRAVQPIHAFRRLKILSMGNPGVGKSCLVKRYCEGRYTPEYVTTIGIDYGVKSVKHNDEEIKVNFWDVGGDPIYYDIRNEFYKDTHGALLVFDVCNVSSFESLDKWITEMHQFANTSVALVLVGNKTDQSPRAVSVSDGEAAASKLGAVYFETSALTGDGVHEMFSALFTAALAAHFSGNTKVNANQGIVASNPMLAVSS